jgi:Phytanoyl-CoA dioxygenase (PhyH)
MTIEDATKALDQDGFCVLEAVFSPRQVEAILRPLEKSLTCDGVGVLGREGTAYAARNVLELWPVVRDVWRQPPLPELLGEILGPRFGLVRVLFFDKPPGRSWALPWHKDLTIAVKDNAVPVNGFSHPTTKAGVPHLEAPVEVLESMLTARIHLDDITDENGPLKVLPGSHKTGKNMVLDEMPPRTVLVTKGDVLLIRPLVAHASKNSMPETALHRRILHLEFASSPLLGDGLAWHDFCAGGASSAFGGKL